MARRQKKSNHTIAGRFTALDEALLDLHLAFRTITAGPDQLLARRGLSRTHHRLLYMIRRAPGLSVGQLLAALAVTKQALHRPLRDLVERKLVERIPDESDGRSHTLQLTTAGRLLEKSLSGAQRARFARAFASAGTDAERGWGEVMRALAGATGDDVRSLLRGE